MAEWSVVLHNGTHVTGEDIWAMELPVFRHRIQVNCKADAEGVRVEKVIGKLLEA